MRCLLRSSKRLQKLQLFRACALYEAGKQHRAEGNWGEARKRFESAKKTEALPEELKGKGEGQLKKFVAKKRKRNATREHTKVPRARR